MRLVSEKGNNPLTVETSAEELSLIFEVLNEFTNATDLDEDEFHARVGYSTAQANELINKIGDVLQSSRSWPLR